MGAEGDADTDKSTDNEEKEKTDPQPAASVIETLSFGSESSRKLPCLFVGLLSAAVTGCLYPAMAFFFAQVFEALGGNPSGPEFMENIRTMAWTFMILGAVAIVSMTVQNTALEVAAGDMTLSLKTSWFDALLRQDMAYYDIRDVGGTATMISAKAQKYRRGVGRKLGEGIQFTLTMVGGVAYAFYASWRVSLVVLAVIPVMAVSGTFMLKVTQGQSARSSKGYAEAGTIAYASVSAIKTILSLNACRTMIEKYNAATEKAYRGAANYMPVVGCAMGTMMGSFLVSYILLTLYGAYLLYREVRGTGCDPSGIVLINEACTVTAMDVFGALMGMSFGAIGIPQISAAMESFQGARVACYPAIAAMKRTIGNGKEDKFQDEEKNKNGATHRDTMPLPKYAIDSSSPGGRKLSSLSGNISFKNVSFAYPTRPDSLVFNGFSLEIGEGKTVALVGPSGSGKSTVVQLTERFYDPTAGSVQLDGVDLKGLNVKWLREQIGLVSQEPVLFARSIRENIAYGCPSATMEQIQEAARLANAHDFISSFPKGYDTEVGDKGAQLSGGQKQRIAIARVLVKNPKILILDEATSALDSESESVVQQALDKLLEASNRTTIVIAHRLSTVRNADMIAVVEGGKVVETGNHDELMAVDTSAYRQLVEAQSGKRASVVVTKNSMSRHSSMEAGYGANGDEGETQVLFKNVSFAYPTRRENTIFYGLNLAVKKGETLALVGSSGGGKSTVIQLIERFYDPDTGTVEMEGTDIKELNLEWLRDQLGLVSQEPTLFNTTIAENISYGRPDATQQEIEEAAKEANAHDFIMSFPDGYETDVGEQGAQVSGGQKQRIAIARALLKRPKILMLDEATSALDSESEKIVQEALDKIMAHKSQTIIVIAHRLSTIRNADRIAVIADGRVKELGTHEELMARPNGRYKRLQEFQSLDKVAPKEENAKLQSKSDGPNPTEKHENDEESGTNEDDDNSVAGQEMANKSENRARTLAKADLGFFFIGSIGAVLAGLVFPAWGIVFAYMIELLYNPVFPCDDYIEEAFGDCDNYYNSEADEMRELSFKVTYGWIGLIASTMLGNIFLMYGFGTASERMNKRVRDAAFKSLLRQEPAFFDKRSVGMITSQLQDDAALIHSFSGEPIRMFVMNVASVLVGVIISFYYMWPFALLTLATLPFLGFGAEVEMRMYVGEDHAEVKDDENSPGGIVVETLLNIRTVASLTIEQRRSKEYTTALRAEDPTPWKTNLMKGSAAGLGFFIQCWGMALLFWWGGWLLYNYPGKFSYTSYLIALFALLFSLSGMATAAQGATNKEKAKAAANRIFYLIDRESKIDPLSAEGKKGV